jgi:hypothetical protein
MAAPIVSAEAALLFSRHPDWSMAEVTQRILAKTAPVTGSSGRARGPGRRPGYWHRSGSWQS